MSARRRARRAFVVLTIVAAALGADLLLRHPATPLPRAWNPAEPLRLGDPPTWLTGFKLSRAARDPASCLAILTEAGIVAEPLPDMSESAGCEIRQRVRLARLTQAQLTPVETRCDLALHLAMWERHGLQPAARASFGEPVAEIEHYSSYSCRAMRTGREGSERMSKHATAEAIDIAGFRLQSGRRILLREGWEAPAEEAAFLRRARDSACAWFATTLGPDCNGLHADHFHLQPRGWWICR